MVTVESLFKRREWTQEGIHPRSKGVKTNGRMFGSTIERAKSGNGERDLAVVAVDR